MILVFLVEDSPTALVTLCRGLEADGDIQVIGSAMSAEDAIQSLPALQPDLLITDFLLPGLDGLGLTRWMMDHCRLPILVVSDLVVPGSTRALACLEAGAVDLAAKPSGFDLGGETWARFRAKVRLLAGIRLRKVPAPSRLERPLIHGRQILPQALPPVLPLAYLALGASTGGPEALRILLTSLKADLRVPVLLVQHMSEGFLTGFADWLSGSTGLPIRLGVNGVMPSPGTVHLAPEGCHMELDATGRIRLREAEVSGLHAPSVDRLFKSLARHHAPATGALLLTGMGQDGAAGLLELRQGGARTAVQDEASSVVFGMPKAAWDLGAAEAMLPLQGLPARVNLWLSGARTEPRGTDVSP